MRSNIGEWMVVVFLSVVAVAVSLTSVYSYLSNRPAASVYPLVHNYPPDYYSNLSWMRFGWEGKFAVTSRYTPEQYPPQFVSILPLFGMIARVAGASLPATYTLLRIVFGFGLLILSFVLLHSLSLNRGGRMIGFLIVLFGVPIWSYQHGVLTFAGRYWSGFDPLARVTFLPHHLLANCFFILALLLLARAVERNDYRATFGAGIAVLLGGWSNPATLYTIGISIAVGALFHLPKALRRLPHFVIVTGAVGMLSLYFYRLQFSVFPFTTYKDVERFWFYPASNGDLLRVLGIASIFAIVAIIPALRSKRLLWAFVVGWFVAPFIGVEILGRFVPVTNARYFQIAPYIPTAILGAFAISMVFERIRSRLIAVMLGIVVIGGFLVSSIPTLATAVRNHFVIGASETSLLVYVPGFMMDGISWLGAQGKPDEVVLAPYWASTMIPGLTGKRVIVGNEVNTFQPQEKLEGYMALYNLHDVETSKRAIANYRIKYVVFELVSEPTGSFLQALGLVKVYQNEGVVIYLTQT